MRRILLSCLGFIPFALAAQFGASFHQSNVPFVGLNYEIGDRFRPELRLGVDNFFDDTALEGVLTYDFIDREEVEAYVGAGLRINFFSGVVVPVGINAYPFADRRFGFQLELAPIFGSDANVLRGSWGIRYRFGS